jgi:hypothetical protein
MSVLIGGKVGIMLKLLDLELQLCQGPLIFLKEGLDLIIIGINNDQLILKFFQLPFLIINQITKLFALELFFLELFLAEVDILRGLEVS